MGWARRKLDRRAKSVADLVDLNAVHSQIIAGLSGSAIDTLDPVPPGVERFLRSAEFTNVVGQVVAVRLLQGSALNVDSIQLEFSELLRLYAGETSESSLFGAVLQACDTAVSVSGALPESLSPEIRHEIEQRVLHSHLAAIQRNLALLREQTPDTLAVYRKFELEYRQQVAHRHRTITPPNFDVLRRVPIDALYVSPLIESIDRSSQGVRSARHNQDVFGALVRRAVLLGDPGGGKSTVSIKLCHALSSQVSTITPTLVILRDFGAEKQRSSGSILQFIKMTAVSKYQIEPPAGAFEHLLMNGGLFVIFDGLDELLDSRYRREISEDVESFCNRYPTVPVLVTSRSVGYDEAPLDPTEFEVFRLAPFDSDQVEDYATKWFSLDIDLPKYELDNMIGGFIADSSIVDDLRRNPLMLALMCNIYRGQGYIPANRPDVYEKCAVMLFERWDKDRGIRVSLPLEHHIRPAMMYLAYTIFSEPGMQGGVAEQDLVALTRDYLLGRRYDDPRVAEEAAQAFVRFCTGRAWVFTDVGTTPDGERLYGFTHRTFLEYFAAYHLVRIHPTAEDLLSVLEPRIAIAEWDIVAQLALQLQNKNVEAAADVFLFGLVQRARGDGASKSHLLSFAARSLSFLVPNAETVRMIATECVRELLRTLRETEEPEKHAGSRVSARAVVGSLLEVTGELMDMVRLVLTDLLVPAVAAGDPVAQTVALYLSMIAIDVKPLEGARYRYWYDTSTQFTSLPECRQALAAASESDVSSAAALLYRRLISVAEFVDNFGVNGLFDDYSVSYLGVRFLSMAESLTLDLVAGTGADEDYVDVEEILAEGYPILMASRMQWRTPRSMILWRQETLVEDTHRVFSPRALSSGALLLCAFVEADSEQFDIALAEGALHLGYLELVRPVLEARRTGRSVTTAGEDLCMGLEEECIEVLRSWAARDVNFTVPR